MPTVPNTPCYRKTEGVYRKLRLKTNTCSQIETKETTSKPRCYSPSPECPVACRNEAEIPFQRGHGDEWRGEPSEALAPVLRSSPATEDGCYGGWKGGLMAMESSAILIRMPRALSKRSGDPVATGPRGGFTKYLGTEYQ
jgi:hypothetical protein